MPYAVVAVQTSVFYGDSWETAFTHELFEMLVDPYGGRFVQSGARFYSLEVGDPVEADRFAYTLPGATGQPVLISDFITENWYDLGADGPYDFAGHVTRARRVLPGGYADYWRHGHWHEAAGKGARGHHRFR